MACNIEAVKELISDLSKNTNAKLVPVVASLEAALKDMELLKTLKRKTGGATTVDKAGITAEMYELGQEIQDLYANVEYAEGKELEQISKDIDKTTKQIAKLQDKLGIEGTVGDRILANEPARRFLNKENPEDTISLKDYFEAKMVGNNLNISEELFGEDFDMLKENVDVNPGEETYFEGAKTQTNDMITAIEDMVKDEFDHSNISKIDVEEEATVNRFQSISRLLLQGKPKGTDYNIKAGKASKDGYTLPKEVVTAIALASNDWLVTEAALRADKRTDDDTKRLLSKAPGDDLSLEEKNRVADVDGFLANAATSIGGVVYKNLGLKVKAKEGENRELLEGKLKTELGLMAMAAMQNDGRIKIHQKKGEEIFGKGNDTTGGKDINVFSYTDEGSLLVDDRTQLFAPNSRFANKIVGTETNMRTPSFTAPKAPRKVKTSSEAGEFFTVAQESQDAVNAQEAQSWEFDNDFVNSYRDMIKDEAGRERLKKLLGYKDPAKAHIELRAGINGKNAQIESNMQYLEELYNQMEVSEEPKMWFPWKFVKNGRFILDTNTFNPQGKKLHRFAIFAKEATVSTKNEDMQVLALAMAFGADVDKRSLDTSKKTWADIKAKLDEMMDDGKSDLDILEAFNDGVEVFDHKNGKDTTTSVHPHDTEHAMGGLAEYRRYRAHVEANGTHIGMTSRLPLETDAITSGYILKTTQLPLLGFEDKGNIDDAVVALTKGGMFTPESEFQNYGEQSESGQVPDAYNTPAAVMTKKIAPVQEALLDNNSNDPEYEAANRTATELALGVDSGEAITEISRSFMKSPFMTFNYGSGLTNIVNAVGEAAIESLYKMMADPKKTAQVQSILDAAIRGSIYDSESKTWASHSKGQKEVEAFAQKFKSATPAQRLELKLPTAVSDNIKSNIAAGVGVALADTFTETYGVYIDAGNKINASFTTMFRLFKAKVDVAIDAKQLELGKDGKRRHLTSAETNEIIRGMAASLPAIQTALANEDKMAKVMIYKTESTFFNDLDGDVVDNGQGRLKLQSGDLSSQSKTYQLIEAASSGAVVPIHYLDGSIQAIVANSGVSALGVHDAWMFNIDEAMEGTRTYNEGTARVSSDYSLTEAIISGLNESINNATPEEIAVVDAAYLKEANGKVDNATSVNQIHTDMDNLYFSAENAREDLFNKELRIEHAALEGSSFVRPAGYTRKERTVELNTAKGTITGKAAEPKKTAPKKPMNVPSQDTNATNIYFGTNENAGLSNFAIRPFTVDGEDYQSVEQAFQMEKLGYIDMPHEDYIRDGAYGTNERIEADMAKETNGAKLKALGQSVREFDSEAWNKDVEAIMAKFIKASFEQNPAALKELLATGDTVLTHTQDKGKWGKLFPKILMDVRAELATEPVIGETTKTGFDTRGTVAFGKKGGKDYIKAQNANAFIGYPTVKRNSSTKKYLAAAEDQGIPVNKYIKPTADTVAFVSVNGKGDLSPANLERTVYEISRVLDADGIVLMDNDTIANGKWNADGEGRVQKELLEMGYEKNLVEIVDGDTKTRVNQFSKEGVVERDKTVAPKQATETATGLRWLNSKRDENVIIDKLGNPKVTVTSTKDLAALSKDYDTLLRERGLIAPGTERADTELVADIFADLDNAIFGETKVTVKFNQHMGKDNVMGYATGKDIQMSTGATFTVDPMKVVLHEFAHTITSDQLKKNPVIDKRVTAMRERAIALGLDKDPLTSYAVTNNAEFLAEAISNPYFQASLKAMKTDGKSTLLAQVKTVFKNLLKRAKADGSLDNALGDVLDVVIGLQTGTATVNGDPTVASEAVPWDEDPAVEPTPEPVKLKTKVKGLNEGQQTAYEEITEFFNGDMREHVLDAAGGTGKTYTVDMIARKLASEGKNITFMAPTHAAVAVLKESTGKDPMTVASGLGIKMNQDTGEFEVDKFGDGPKINYGDYVIIDEASMLTESIHEELLTAVGRSGKILFMGDSAQLPPIRTDADRDKFAEKVGRQPKEGEASLTLSKRDEAGASTLTTVVRFDPSSKIGPLTTALRENVLAEAPVNPLTLMDGKDSVTEKGSVIFIANEEDTLEAFAEDFKENEESIMVTFNNESNDSPQSVKSLNKKARRMLNPENLDTVVKGDILVAYAGLQISKTTSITNSQRVKVIKAGKKRYATFTVDAKRAGRANVNIEIQQLTVDIDGKIESIKMVTPKGRQELMAEQEQYKVPGKWPLFFALEGIYGTDALKAEFGYAVTSHKSQGSSYENVYVFADNIQNAYGSQEAKAKSMYVAASRPKNKLVINTKTEFGKAPVKTPVVKTGPMKTDTAGLTPALRKTIESIGNITNMTVRSARIAEHRARLKNNPEAITLLDSIADGNSYTQVTSDNTYQSPLNSKENPAIITDNIQSPKAKELGIDIDKAIAAEYAKAENKFKKCNK